MELVRGEDGEKSLGYNFPTGIGWSKHDHEVSRPLGGWREFEPGPSVMRWGEVDDKP